VEESKAASVLNCMHISDIHEENVFDIVANSFSETKSKPIDILFISGDLTYKGKLDKLKRIYEQLEYLFMHYIIRNVFMIPGNHDLSFERTTGFESRANAMAIFAKDPRIVVRTHGAAEICGVKIFGSAWTPEFYNWAFNYFPDKAKTIWNDIPNDTEVLVTHGPPLGILDQVIDWNGDRRVGCHYLREKIEATPSIKYHLFGHIHEGYGREEWDGVTYMNSAIMNRAYKPVNKPQYFNISRPKV